MKNRRKTDRPASPGTESDRQNRPPGAVDTPLKRPPVILIAPNAFKGSLDPMQAAKAMARGARRAIPQAKMLFSPIADGGDGSLDVVASAVGGRRISCASVDPLGRPIRASYFKREDGKAAFIEMARAGGLTLLSERERNPLNASTRGVGILMQKAAAGGPRSLYVGIGGSATNDGGAGAASVFGFRFLDEAGRELDPTGGALERLGRIAPPAVLPRKRLKILAACDVDNPLLGPNGASRVYAPQKGATPRQVERLESALARLADCAERDLGIDMTAAPGSGAAGGFGGGLLAFFGATLRSGFEILAELTNLRGKIREADLILTGEGSMDSQTLSGKGPMGLLRMAGRVPVAAICGQISDEEKLLEAGFWGLYAIRSGGIGLRACMEGAERLLAERTFEAAASWATGRRI